MQVSGYEANNLLSLPIITHELEVNKIDWKLLQKVLNKKYISFRIDSNGTFVITFSAKKPFSQESAYITLTHLKYLLSVHFHEAYRSRVGKNFINLARLIKDDYYNSYSCLSNKKDLRIDAEYRQIVNRMSYCPSLNMFFKESRIVEDVFKKIFEFLSLKDLHHYECVNREGYHQASLVWEKYKYILNLPQEKPALIRKKVIRMGKSINRLIRAKILPKQALRKNKWGFIDRELTLLGIQKFNENLNKAFFDSLSLERSYWKDFLNLGVNPMWISENGNSTLLRAIEYGNDDLLKIILNSESVDINHADEKGITPLHRACRRELLWVVKCLVAKGADINAVDEKGYKPADYGKYSLAISQFFQKDQF